VYSTAVSLLLTNPARVARLDPFPLPDDFVSEEALIVMQGVSPALVEAVQGRCQPPTSYRAMELLVMLTRAAPMAWQTQSPISLLTAALASKNRTAEKCAIALLDALVDSNPDLLTDIARAGVFYQITGLADTADLLERVRNQVLVPLDGSFFSSLLLLLFRLFLSTNLLTVKTKQAGLPTCCASTRSFFEAKRAPRRFWLALLMILPPLSLK